MIKKHSMINKHAMRAAAVALAALGAACTLTPDPYTPAEFAAKAAEDRGVMFKDHEPLIAPLTLAEAMARVLTYNLDRRAKLMEEALALGQLDLDFFDFLPAVTVGGGYTLRNKPNATRSKDLVTGQVSSGNPTFSQDRRHTTLDLGATWNLLDFGASWFNARQNADRALIAGERRRKSMAYLLQEVRYAFWRAAAAQELEKPVQAAIRLTERALANSRKVEQELLRDPTGPLIYRKTMLETLRSLEATAEELVTARAELAALINLPPGTQLRLAMPRTGEMKAPAWSLPVEQMEEIAFTRNPDLREQVYLTRIAIDDTRKAILRLLPGISFEVKRPYDSNSLLVSNNWIEGGVKITQNLVNLISAPYQIDVAEAGEAVAEARRLALRMAVLAQVHIARHQYLTLARQYELAAQIAKVEQKLAATAANRQESDALSMMDRVSAEASAIGSRLRSFQSHAQMQMALGKMQATLGLDLLPVEHPARSLTELTEAIARRLSDLDRGVVPEPTPPAPEAVPVASEPAAPVTAAAEPASPSAAPPAPTEPVAVAIPVAEAVPAAPAAEPASLLAAPAAEAPGLETPMAVPDGQG